MKEDREWSGEWGQAGTGMRMGLDRGLGLGREMSTGLGLGQWGQGRSWGRGLEVDMGLV